MSSVPSILIGIGQIHFGNSYSFLVIILLACDMVTEWATNTSQLPAFRHIRAYF